MTPKYLVVILIIFIFAKKIIMGLLSSILPSAITGVLGIGGAALDAASNNRTNQTNLQIARETNQANLDAVRLQNEANVNLWREQTEYNNPANMMARYQEAGLNPNLIYGNASGNVAGSAPSQNAAHFMAPSLRPYQGAAAAFTNAANSFLSTYSAIKDLQVKDAQIENLKAQANRNTSLLPFDLDSAGWRNQLNSINYLVGQENWKKLQLGNHLGIQLLPYQTEMARLNNLRIGQQIDNLKKDNILKDKHIENMIYQNLIKQFDADLVKQGVRPNDSLIWRYVEPFTKSLFGKDSKNLTFDFGSMLKRIIFGGN